MALVAGVDSSTQSTKVQIRDLDSGRLVGEASAAHPVTTPPRSEQDPAAWWQAFQACWESLGHPQVAAIAVAGQQHGMVALDAARRVIRPAKLWNDTESAPDSGWLLKQLGGPEPWVLRTGSVPLAAFTATKLSWLHRSEPHHWARLAHVLLPHDWMTLQLTGELVTDRGDASGTGYWSPTDEGYCLDILAVIDREREWSSVLPRVAGPGEVVGTWQGAHVAPGTGDNMAAALGLGLGRGVASMSIGTSGVVATVHDRPVADPSGTVAGFADAAGGFLPLVCTLNAAKVLDTVAALIGLTPQSLSDAALSAADAGGVTLLPYFDGERTPNLPSASGWVSGLRTTTTAAHLARAALEAVACGLLDGLDALHRFAPVERIVLTGGAARNDALCAVIAALADRPVSRSREREAVAAGACVQAATVALPATAEEVAQRWSVGGVEAIEPAAVTDDVRTRYAALRDQAYPS